MTDIDDKLAALRIADSTDFWTADRIDALVFIPMTSDPWQQISVTLEDIPVAITIRWNEVASGWFWDILSTDETIDIKGLRLSPGINLMSGLALSELGRVYCIDEEAENAEPTLDGLGDRFKMWYLPLSAI